MSTLEKAKREFEILKSIKYESEDEIPIVLEYENEILALVEKFGESGQSGGSAPFTAGILASAVKQLCLHQTITPITGEDWEWTDVDFGNGKESYKQNMRNSAIFKLANGKCYYLNAIHFQGEDEYDTFSGTVEEVESRNYIKSFPFTPKTFYIDVKREPNNSHPNGVSCGDGDYLYTIKDREQLKKVFAYYDRFNNNEKSK